MKKSKKSKIKKRRLPGLALVLPRRPFKFKRTKPAEERVSEALSNVPRITNETVGEHREEVLSSARKYIYPLQHSKHSVVRTSVGLLVLVLVLFFAYCGLALYKLQATSGFLYGVTKVVPFPVAKAGGAWVSYESYLFELRRNMHYYHVQQQADFSTRDGQNQLQRLKQQALDQVIQTAYVKELAAKNQVSVSDRDVDNEVALVRSQNRLGNNDRVFKEVLAEYWGWSESDFRRELKQQMLQQAVVVRLDTTAQAAAQTALVQLQGGADFGSLAGKMSEDPATKGNSGIYPTAITPDSHDLAPAVIQALFQLKPGQTSVVINAGSTLEILKVIDGTAASVHAAHIQFNLQPITAFTAPLQKSHPPHEYIKI